MTSQRHSSFRWFGFTALGLAMLGAETRADTLPGRGLQFDGTDDIVRVPVSDVLDDATTVTVEAWVHTTWAEAGGIVGMWGPGGLADRFQVYLDTGEVVARIELGGGGAFSVSHSAPVDVWFHVAMTYDGTDLRLYLDGVPVGAVAAAGGLGAAGNDLLFGREEIFVDEDHYLRGWLDEVRIWDFARAPEEIARFYNQRILPETEGLIGSWSFSGGDQLVLDASPHAHDGTLGFDSNADVDDPSRVTSDAPLRWMDLGFPLAGVDGEPRFEGEGTLAPGSTVQFELRNARPQTLAFAVVGWSPVYVPFQGGTLVPSPDFLFRFLTDKAGELTFDTIWPKGFAPCTPIYIQWWIIDAAGPHGWSASNALFLETP